MAIDIIDPTEAAFPFDLNGDLRAVGGSKVARFSTLRQLALTKAIMAEDEEEMLLIYGESILI